MNFDDIERVLAVAKVHAQHDPGRYGGRYVARQYVNGQDEFVVLEDDDPEKYRDDENIDVIAHVTAEAAHGIGHARHWINSDGTVDREYFDQ